MNFLTENWSILFSAVIFLAVFLWQLVRFFRQPSEDQVKQVKEWLLFAVIGAEKQFGSGTGTLKLRSVYDLFVGRFPWVAKMIPFETFALWVDEALEKMQEWLKSDPVIADYVSGTSQSSCHGNNCA